jgi:hypothetical protein
MVILGAPTKFFQLVQSHACVTIPRLLARVCPSTPKIDGFYHSAAKTRAEDVVDAL